MPFANPLYDPSKRLIRLPTVQFPDAWPKAPSQYAFIFEAINIVGASLCGDEWTGKELLAITWLESPWSERLRMRVWRPSPPVPHSLASPRPPARSKPEPIEHKKDWQAATLNKDWEANSLALERLNRSVDWIAERCRDGELTSHLRLRVGGGPLLPMKAHEWNVDAPLFTFVMNGGNNRICHEFKHAGPFETFVFFERRQLIDTLKRDPDAPLIVAEADLARLSPYLRLAVQVALQRGYVDRKNCDTKDVREAEVTAAWPDYLPDLEPVPAMVQAIAKVMNFPDPEAIERGRRGGNAAKRGSTAKG